MYNFAGLILIVFVEVDRFDEWIEEWKDVLRDQEVGTETTRTDVQRLFFKIKNTETSLNVSKEALF